VIYFTGDVIKSPHRLSDRECHIYGPRGLFVKGCQTRPTWSICQGMPDKAHVVYLTGDVRQDPRDLYLTGMPNKAHVIYFTGDVIKGPHRLFDRGCHKRPT